MAIDVSATVMSQLTALFAAIFSSEQTAQEFASDPDGVAEQYGLTGADLSGGVNVTQAALQACQQPGVPASAQQAVQSYAAAPHPPAYTVQEAITQVTEVTQVTYEDNRTIIDQIVQNNTDINVGENSHVDTIDVDNLTQGDHSVGNTGDNATVAGATGDRANANTGDNATQNSGDGGVAVGGNSNVNAPIITGGVSGGVVGTNQNLNDTVVGDGNQTANVDSASGDVFIPFGSGNTAVQHSDVHDANVGVGGDAQNISNNDASQGGAIAGHDAHGSYSYQDNDTTSSDNSQHFDYSTHADNGSHAQGGFQNQNAIEDNDNNDFDHGPKEVEEAP